MIYLYDDLKSIKYNDYIEIVNIIKRYNSKIINNYIKYNNRLNNALAKFILLSILYEKNMINEILTYDININGKPTMKNIKFNISHCDEAVAVGIGDFDIGIDVESKIINWKEIKDISLSNRERNILMNEKKFRNIWTLKESLIKYKGNGIDERYLKNIDFSNYVAKTKFKYNNLIFLYYEFSEYCLALCGLEKQEIKKITYEDLKRRINLLKREI